MPKRYPRPLRGSVPERPKGADCKSAGSAYGGSNPPRPTLLASRNPRSSVEFPKLTHTSSWGLVAVKPVLGRRALLLAVAVSLVGPQVGALGSAHAVSVKPP